MIRKNSLPFISGVFLFLVLACTLSGFSGQTDLPDPAAEIPSAASTQIWLPFADRATGLPPVPPSQPVPEWTQDAYNAQRTGYTAEIPKQPWSLLWTWNGPDTSGGAGGHFYDAPRQAHTVTGAQYVYVPAGSNGLYALRKIDGQPSWHLDLTGFNATPAYDSATRSLYAGGVNGRLYKVNVDTGLVVGDYDAGSPLNRSVLIAGGYVYVVSEDGRLHKVNPADMSKVWVYAASSPAATPPAFSTSRNLILYATQDLYVHAVRSGDGAQHWRVQPTVHDAVYPYTFDGYWPVVAEQHDLVFVRLNLGMDGMWSGPASGHVYPNTNAATRSFLDANPQWKNLFALDLENGQPVFTPAVGFGGVESLTPNGPDLEVGPVPVIRLLPDGSEVAYQLFRSGQGNPPDGRWDTHLGEMVLDNQTVPGLVAGDLRFVQFSNSYIYITDEQTPLSMAGDRIFNAHWGASESARILDRSPDKGLTVSNPITSEAQPPLVRRVYPVSPYDPLTHWTTAGLTLFNDSRYWLGPAWWVYWNTLDPPTPSSSAYSGGILPRYTYVSDGYVVVEGNGGELFVLVYNPF